MKKPVNTEYLQALIEFDLFYCRDDWISSGDQERGGYFMGESFLV
jgi:hypothetical protein